ncbi:pumilio-like protein 12-like isoform X1 [Iris pallida]|uniref:Pumilio-like protein 12-like isoform X1 n=1 Tax=Iris pallida TaxID=29817 RepID=A0AAX6DY21_IRIPA|nr:pumilio-like protein 12-like isoform X1 [Iris pallida]
MEGGGRTTEQDEQDGTGFQLPSDTTLYNSPLSSTKEGSSIFYGGLATDQTFVTNGKQNYESNNGYEAHGPRAEQDGSNLPDEKALALALEGLGFKEGVVAEASNPYACYQTSPGRNFMNNAQPPFAVDTLGMTIPQLQNEIGVGGECNGQRTEALLHDLVDQRSRFPVYHGASPMNPGIYTPQPLPTSNDLRRSPYQHQTPLPEVADSLRASPYQPQFYEDIQAPSLMPSRHLLEQFLYQQQLPNNGSELLQSGNYMNSAVDPLNGCLTQPICGIPSDNARCKSYSQFDLSTMGGNPCQYHPWSLCSRKGKSFEFPCRSRAYSANDLLDWQALNKFPEEVLRRSHGMNPQRYHNRSAYCGNNYGRSLFNRQRNPCLSNVASRLDCRDSRDYSPDNLDAKTIDSKFDSVDSVKGKIYSLAKDQHGCHFLQSKLDKGCREDIGKIYDEIIDHIVELMTNPFGNNLVQKFLEICNEKQRVHILHAITIEEGLLIRISCNMHGTRVVQKVIETLETPEQISLFVHSLKHPGIISLMKDTNGNHVAQHCLKFFSPEFNEFLYRAAIAHCTELAVDRQGCCVLQKCILHSEGVWKERILSEICSSSHFLSSNAYGNYVVQYVLESSIPWAKAAVLGQLEGSYEKLSTQKHGSNVVEKCLYRASEEQLVKIVNILMNSPRFLQIAVDPYGNYVIQTALKQCKGALYSALVGAIRSHRRVLHNNQYGKKVLASIK